MTAQFLSSFDGDSDQKDVVKLINLLTESVTKEDPQMVRRICETIATISESQTGFFTLYRVGTFEALANVLENMDDVELDVQDTHNAMVQQVALWMDEVDHVEFFKL